jgi:hypothetical protein
MRTLWKHERSVSKKSLPKKPRVREDAVGSLRAVSLTRPEAEGGTADTARRGRKRKSSTPEADEGTVDTARRSRKHKSSA